MGEVGLDLLGFGDLALEGDIDGKGGVLVASKLGGLDWRRLRLLGRLGLRSFLLSVLLLWSRLGDLGGSGSSLALSLGLLRNKVSMSEVSDERVYSLEASWSALWPDSWLNPWEAWLSLLRGKAVGTVWERGFVGRLREREREVGDGLEGRAADLTFMRASRKDSHAKPGASAVTLQARSTEKKPTCERPTPNELQTEPGHRLLCTSE